ncbi:DUF2188 domain-containing protein [Halobaculum sp. D14]|uniref:DUF2188 domain-containing protein n=1 Tax=Halobaculum sp. D14 TaxID=3421642 RepID=UPI003EB8DF0E
MKVQSDPKSGSRTGDWIVQVNNSTVSRHRLKSAAVDAARTRAKKRGDVLKTQKTTGTWRTVASY